MKKIYLKLFFLLAFLGSTCIPVTAQYQCEELVWQDEFDGTALDQSKWQYEVGGGGWGTGQLDYATDRPENVRVENGNLYLTLREENYNDHAYTSGRINTYKKHNFKYGRIEARVKGVYSQGVGFAFWMLGANYESIWWPKSGEVDIFEQTGSHPDFNIGTAHFEEAWGHSINQGSYKLPNGERFADEYHTAGILWTPDSISWYIDDNYYHTMYIDEPINGFDPFNRDFFLILSVGMGGLYSGPPDATTVTPQSAVVDWVRVYKGNYVVEVTGDETVYENETKEYEITQAQNASYNWTIPQGATIVSGQGTNKITVKWGNVQSAGAIQALVSGCETKTYALAVEVEPAIIVEKIFEDFEANHNIYYEYYSGVLDTMVANPDPDPANSSSLVGRYERNAAEAWDALVMRGIETGHAGAFIQGSKRLFLDVYTDAPIGTRITLGLENGAVAVPEQPYGKHSNYEAFTTVQNGWETLEFELTAVPDKYAGSYKIDKAVFLIDPGQNTGNTYYFDNFRSGRSGEAQPVRDVDILKDWDEHADLTLVSNTGQYEEFVSNPSPDEVNTSENVLAYTRDASLNYNNITYDVNFEDASPFREGTNSIAMDVFTNAAPGKVISLHLVDASIDGSGDWQAPIHSIYEAKITAQGEWQTIEFNWSSNPNPAVPNVSVNRMVLLIDENANTGDTYYIDNIRVNGRKATRNYTLDNVWQDYEANNHLNYVYSADPYVANVANPATDAVNESSLVGQYSNVGGTDDWLVFNIGKIIDAKAFKEKTKVVTVDVYTNAPMGTVITMGLEAGSLATPENWPTGRHSDYATATKTPNKWQTLTFIYSNSSDPSTPPNLVNKAIFTFNQGKEGDYVFYLDNFKVMKEEQGEPYLAQIDITPGNVPNVKIGDVISFSAAGIDQDGNDFPVNISWSVSGGGSIDAATGEFVATEAGTHTVTARNGDITGTATIVINNDNVGANLALNKPAFSSANENSGSSADKAVDGTLNTRWESPFSDPQWIYVDLQKNYALTKVVLNWETASGKIYDIQVSQDAENWNTIYSETNGDGGIDEILLSDDARYVRVHGTARNTGWGYSLWELEVYGTDAEIPVLTSIEIEPKSPTTTVNGAIQLTATGYDQFGNELGISPAWTTQSPATITNAGIFSATQSGYYDVSVAQQGISSSIVVTVQQGSSDNIALFKPVTASSTQSGLSETQVNDGAVNTRWGSNWEDPQWVQIDLEAVYNISKVVLNWEAAAAKAYQLQVSNDGSDWNTLFSEDNGNGGLDEIVLSGSGRYIRMYGTERTTGYGYSLFEFEVYGSPATGATAFNDVKASAVEMNKMNSDFRIYPVPVTNVLNLEFGTGRFDKLEIMDVTGKSVVSRNISGLKNLQIDFASYSNGLYIIKLNGGEGSETKRIVKQ